MRNNYAANHVLLRDGVFYYVRRVPIDLAEHCSVKRLCFSLRTKSYKSAITCCVFIVGCNSNYQSTENEPKTTNAGLPEGRMGDMQIAIQKGGKLIRNADGSISHVEMPDGILIGKDN